MEENQNKKRKQHSTNIEEILLKREQLEKALHEQYKKEVTIFFSDICGYTEYIDKRGDISGRALLLKHNRILLPLIEKNSGKVIELIGDAVMASFEEPINAVKAAIDIQKELEHYNSKCEGADQIHVKIGINVGDALVDEEAVFQSITGDVANVASRIQSQAGKGQIFISKALYRRVCGSEDLLCRFHGTVKVKGKEQALEIYKVVWRDDEVVVQVDPRVRIVESPVGDLDQTPDSIFYLDMTKHGEVLKVVAQEGPKGEKSTIQHYEEVAISTDLINARCNELIGTLNRANRKGRLTRDVLVRLREVGQVLYDEFFPLTVKEKLRKSKADYLALSLDDGLMHIPWELINDGQDFLCRRFNMGRLVKTKQSFLGARTRIIAKPLRMMILADPNGDLKAAYEEGTRIRDMMDKHQDLVNATLRSENIPVNSIREKMRNFDIIHFAGHADYNRNNPKQSGWRLTDGSLNAGDIIKMAGTASMPALIFSNACQSARSDMWGLNEHFEMRIFGLANAFLLVGVKHYIGTFWEVLDEPSRSFALEFYHNLFLGMSVGEAVKEARASLIEEYGEETIVWASYLLYGDPTFNYLKQVEGQEPREEVKSEPLAQEAIGGRTREEVIDFSATERPGKKKRWLVMAASVLLVAGVLFGLYHGFFSSSIGNYEKEAQAYFGNGLYTKAAQKCEILQRSAPDRALSYVILGKISLLEGNKKQAEEYFQKAISVKECSDLERSEALRGLGRIASISKNKEKALSFYRKAASLFPNGVDAFMAQAILLQELGELPEAIKVLHKAKTINPEDASIQAMAREAEKRLAIEQDIKRREKIDQLVGKLLKSYRNKPSPQYTDTWTSRPVTLWIMDFNIKGFNLLEGEEILLQNGIQDKLMHQPRLNIVDRVLLDRVLEELKLGTSNLADPVTALSLGRIMAARIMVNGNIYYSGSQIQISMRFIETETSRVLGAVNEMFQRPVTASEMAERMASRIKKRLEAIYPLRGIISGIHDKKVIINIGEKQGVAPEQKFKVLDTECELRIVSVGKNQSSGVVDRGDLAQLKEGLKVKMI